MAPASVESNPLGATNSNQQAFAEKQGVTLTRDIICDNKILAEGETVNSHMIFYNENRSDVVKSDADRVWTFDGEIICVMSSSNGLDINNSNSLLAVPDTKYPGTERGRGLEPNDDYTVNGNQISVSMTSGGSGDWIRVVTKSTTPVDDVPPAIICVPGPNPQGDVPKGADKGKNDGGNFIVTAIDNVDGEMQVDILDSESQQELGPIPHGSSMKHTVAKGLIPLLRFGNNNIDYQLRTQGSIVLSATDEAGNTGTATCE